MIRRIFPIIGLVLILLCLCESVSAYLTVSDAVSWSFKVRPLAYSISDAELIPTDTGWIVVVTFAPVEGPTSITLSIPGEEEAFTP